MVTSPLALSILAGSQNQQSMDPAVLAAMPRLNLGQAMMQHGLDSSAAYPMQALARLANAYAGNRIFDKALSGITSAYGQAASDAAATLPDGHPLRAALLSPDPTVRAQGLAAYKTGLLQLSEPYTQKAGEARKVSDTTLSTSTAPQSPEGKLAADTQNAGTFAPNVPGAPSALASALLKQSTDNGMQFVTGPNGMTTARQIQGYVPGRANLAGAIAGQEAANRYPFENALENNKPITLGPEQQVNVNPNRVTPNGTTMPSRIVDAATAPAAPQAAAVPAPTQAPQTAPAPTPTPSAAPPPAAVPAQAGNGAQIRYQGTDPGLVRQQHEADMKEVEADRELALKSQQDLGNLAAIKDIMARTKTGWGAEQKLEAARIMKSIGVPDDKIKEFADTNVSDSQALSKLFTMNSAAAARTMGAREPGSVISMFKNAYQNLGTDPQAVAFMTNVQAMQHTRDSELANRKTNYLNESFNGYSPGGKYRGLQGFNEDFNKTNSSEDYLHAAEAMTGKQFAPWGKITDAGQQHAIISLIPKGAQFMGPDGNMYVKN